MKTAFLAVVGVMFVGAPSTAHAASPAEIPSALAIVKSNNKNQAHYAVRVDDACLPVGSAPVHAYWRMFEKSADAVESLSEREERALGIERQDVDHDSVRIVLRGLPGRIITLHTWRTDSATCAATATTTIAGEVARISNVYVKMKLFGVDYVQLTGLKPDGAVVSERLSLS